MESPKPPFGLHTVTPYLIVDDVRRLLDFLAEIFGAESRGQPRTRSDGSIQHAEVKIGDSVIMMGEPMEGFPPMTAMLYVYVPDSDKTYKDALDAGAVSVQEPTTQPHGDRYGGVRDVAGITWFMVTHVGHSSSE